MGEEESKVKPSRREQRLQLTCAVLIMPGTSSSFLGQVLDISAGGIGLKTSEPVAANTSVSVLLDPDALPTADVEAKGLPSLRGIIRSVKKLRNDPDGQAYRLGIAFYPLPEEAETRILQALSRVPIAVPTPTMADLGSGALEAPKNATARGRELLYNEALHHLRSGRFEDAERLATDALRGAPLDKSYRALVWRAKAEAALTAGKREIASKEVAAALTLAPGDKELLALAARIKAAVGPERPPPPKGLFSKLLGR
jgi:hypothetical protein